MTGQPKRPWFRFSLRTLFAAVLLCGVLLWAYLLWRDISKARAAWDFAYNGFYADVLTIDELNTASIGVRTAEARVPFYTHAAGTGHLARMQSVLIHAFVMREMAAMVRPMDVDGPHKCVNDARLWLEEN